MADDDDPRPPILEYRSPDADRVPGPNLPVRIVAGGASGVFLLFAITLSGQHDAQLAATVSFCGSIFCALIAFGIIDTKHRQR